MRWLRSPALHMLVIGGLVYAATFVLGGSPLEERPEVVVPKHGLDIALRAFAEENGRIPSKDEQRAILDALIDQEVLYAYALEHGMDKHPAAQRRLAQIAEFVAPNPHERQPVPQRAAQALELGLHHGDMVVRRILIDSARRLIRAVVLLHEPSADLAEEYLRANEELFERPVKSRITQVFVNGFKWPDTEERALELLRQIRAESIAPEMAETLGDDPMVAAHLPLLTEKSLSRRFDKDFASAVMDQPAGDWVGPLASRYGHHLVYVHERTEAHVPPLEEIQDRVKERLLQKLADEWLALRLQEIRLAYDIVTPPGWP